MSNVINSEDRFRAPDAGESTDLFLVNEGLELLAIYRAITNKEVRLAAKDLIVLILQTIKAAEH